MSDKALTLDMASELNKQLSRKGVTSPELTNTNLITNPANMERLAKIILGEKEEIQLFEVNGVKYHRHPNGGGLVAETARVAETAYVGPFALVKDKAQVLDEARIEDRAVISEKAVIREKAQVSGSALVCDSALVYGSTRVCGSARVFGSAQVYDSAWISGLAQVCGSVHKGYITKGLVR